MFTTDGISLVTMSDEEMLRRLQAWLASEDCFTPANCKHRPDVAYDVAEPPATAILPSLPENVASSKVEIRGDELMMDAMEEEEDEAFAKLIEPEIKAAEKLLRFPPRVRTEVQASAILAVPKAPTTAGSNDLALQKFFQDLRDLHDQRLPCFFHVHDSVTHAKCAKKAFKNLADLRYPSEHNPTHRHDSHQPVLSQAALQQKPSQVTMLVRLLRFLLRRRSRA